MEGLAHPVHPRSLVRHPVAAAGVAVVVAALSRRAAGFQESLNAILSYLPPPPQRQTMLFSATQT